MRLRKQEYATCMVNQLCFHSEALLSWLGQSREAGIYLPLRIGVAAPLQARKLVELALEIGVGSAVKFLTKLHGNQLVGRACEPAHLLVDILAAPDLDDLRTEGLHVLFFNQVDPMVD